MKTGYEQTRTIRKVTKTVNRKLRLMEGDYIRLDYYDINRIFDSLLRLKIIECVVTINGSHYNSEWDWWYKLA